MGSGLVVTKKGKSYLITAAHNLSGINPDGSTKAFPPIKIKIETYQESVEISLLESGADPSDHDSRTFKVNQLLDIAILPLAQTMEGLDEGYINEATHWMRECQIGEDCFVIGFPCGITTNTSNGILPIWKSATIASEPEYTKEYLLIDTWGEQGLSGSPVFLKNREREERQGGRRKLSVSLRRPSSRT